jgi:hypothetical protein
MLAPRASFAQPKPEATRDAARADELFKTAKDELKHGLAADACAHFAESKRLAPGVGVTLYLGDCYQRVGRTASAWIAFREAEILARAHKDKRAELAHQRAEALEPKVNRLTIQVAGPAPATPLDVTCDGHPVARDSWGTPVPIDPGEHVIVAQSGSWSRTYGANVDPKALATTITIELPAPEPRPAPVARATAEPLPAASPPPPAEAPPAATLLVEPPPVADANASTRFWLTITSGAVGVAGLAVGTVFGILATSHRNQSNGPCDASDYCTSQGLSLRSQALNEATVSTVSFIVGGAGAVGALASFLLVPSSSGPAPAGLTVSPAMVGTGTGAIVRSAF